MEPTHWIGYKFHRGQKCSSEAERNDLPVRIRENTGELWTIYPKLNTLGEDL